MTMKLWSWDISPYAARVRMQIYAKGLTHIATGQTPFILTQKVYEDRPLSRIPSLEIGGDAIPESAVIAEYLEEAYPEPSLLGSTPLQNAHIRTLARIGDVYLMNTAFMLGSQTRTLSAQLPVPTGIDSIVELLTGQLASSLRTLDRMIGRDGFACLGRLTLADCALVPALSYVQYALLNRGLADPIAGNANVAAYQAAIQRQEPAARVLAEFDRGREERREQISTGELERIRAENQAAKLAAERTPSAGRPL
jgi:glutathione S-transferase